MKTITICEKEYPVSCNAFTRFQYKTIFGRGIFNDIKILSDFSDKQEKVKAEIKDLPEEEQTKRLNSLVMESLDDFIDVIERIAYILIYTANDKIESFNEWLKGIDKIDLSASWISEVTELAVNSFC